jgi:hypothetical protein
MPTISQTVRRTAAVSVERLFDTVVAEDVLPKVLHRWGPVPAVVGTRDLTGPWDTPGSQRTVVLGDGSTAREQVLLWNRAMRFEYRVDSFTSPIGRLADHAIGSWAFMSAGGESSSFEWTYTFHPRGPVAALPLRAFVPTAWARYMAQCAERLVQLATRG